jgi:hypothetical protein
VRELCACHAHGELVRDQRKRSGCLERSPTRRARRLHAPLPEFTLGSHRTVLLSAQEGRIIHATSRASHA